jgi:putative transposase
VDDRRRDIALFRYALIRVAVDATTPPRQRGALVRALVEAEHLGPDGTRVRVSCSTLDRWIKAWSVGGFEALLPTPRKGRADPPDSPGDPQGGEQPGSAVPRRCLSRGQGHRG